VPEPEHVNPIIADLITKFIATHEKTTDLARIELRQPLAETRRKRERLWRICQSLGYFTRSPGVGRSKEIVEPYEI